MLYIRILCWLFGSISGILWLIYLFKKNKIKALSNTSIIFFVFWIIALAVLYFLSSKIEKNYLEKILGNTILIVAGAIGIWGLWNLYEFRQKIVSFSFRISNKKVVLKEIKTEVEEIYKKEESELNISITGLVLFIFSLIWLAIIRNT